MYRTAPPAIDRVRRETPLRLTRIVRREFDDGPCPAGDPELGRYYADLAALHGIGYRHDVIEQGAGNTFPAMARAVLADLVIDPIDLVIIAQATPDLDPRVSAGVSLSDWLPGEPLVFAISDVASTVVITALRLAREYARRHGYQRVLVLVMEQNTFPYETTAMPARDAATVLLLESERESEVK
jgi:hypothetical protein